jgi:hypothetical protein
MNQLIGAKVQVYQMVVDKDKPMISAGPGQGMRHPFHRAFKCHGVCLGLSTMWEELRDGVGQYPVMVVLMNDGKVDEFPLHLVEMPEGLI